MDELPPLLPDWYGTTRYQQRLDRLKVAWR
jgi:hypothetical protein